MKGATALGYARFVIADRSAILPPGRVRRAVSTTSVLFYSSLSLRSFNDDCPLLLKERAWWCAIWNAERSRGRPRR